MSNRNNYICGLIVICIVSVSTLLFYIGKRNINEYQVVAGKEHTVLLNTATGESWTLVSGGHVWQCIQFDHPTDYRPDLLWQAPKRAKKSGEQ